MIGEAVFPSKMQCFQISVVIKSSKVTSRPFPKRTRVGTYARDPTGCAEGLPSQEASVWKRRPQALTKPVSAIVFEKAQKGLSRGGAAR
jgi:hypothetical protein